MPASYGSANVLTTHIKVTQFRLNMGPHELIFGLRKQDETVEARRLSNSRNTSSTLTVLKGEIVVTVGIFPALIMGTKRDI